MYRLIALAATLLLAAPAAARVPHGSFHCLGPGDWAEHGTLTLGAHGRYVYRHTMPAMDHRVSRGRYRVSGDRILFLTGEYRSRGFLGHWRASTRRQPGGWIHFTFEGTDTHFNCGRL